MSEAAQLKHVVADLRKELDQLYRERAEQARVIAALQNENFALKQRVLQ